MVEGTDEWMDGRTEGRTDERTRALIEMRSRRRKIDVPYGLSDN